MQLQSPGCLGCVQEGHRQTLDAPGPFHRDKVLYHSDRVDRLLKNEVVWPVHAKIDPTNACNHRCPDCIFESYLAERTGSLDEVTMFRLIGQLAEVGVKAVTFTGGGEPLVNRSTPAAIAYAHGLGLECGLITNGTLLVNDSIQKVVDNCLWIRISLDAPDSKRHRATHGTKANTWLRTVDNLRQAVKYRRARQRNCVIGVGYLTAAKTRDGIVDAAALCESLGVDYIQYRPYHQADILMEGWPHVWAEIFEAMEKARQLFDGAGFRVLWAAQQFRDIVGVGWGRDYKRCDAHAFEAVIGATGDVWFCCAYKGEKQFSLGNIRDQAFRDIWLSERREKLYRETSPASCVPLCRLHQANRSLAGLREGRVETLGPPPAHVNFL